MRDFPRRHRRFGVRRAAKAGPAEPVQPLYRRRSGSLERYVLRKEKAAEIHESIRQILWKDWDPIGINDSGPDDEYDSYVGGIYRLLVSGASEYQIMERLYQLETTSMGMNGNREGLKSVAEKLMKLNVSL